MKKNVASQVVGAQLNSKTDGSAVTTGTTTVYVTGDGGTQAAGSVGSGACTHEGQGFWTYAPAQAETNFDHVAFTFTNTSAVAATVQIYTSFPQTGDNFARLGAPAGASVSADVAAVKAETAAILADTNELQTDWVNGGRLDLILDARASQTSVDDLPTNAELATALDPLPTAAENADAVWDEVLAGHLTAGSTGNALNAAGSAGDPWSTALPGAYGAGTAGKIIGDNIDATISSRASPTNITAGTITTVTNLTNAPTNGDLTATMKASVTTAATASTPALSTAGNAAVADKILGRNLAGGSDGTRTVQDALRALRNKTSISAGTLTVTQEDDTTAAWTAAVTTAAGDPLTSIDPA